MLHAKMVELGFDPAIALTAVEATQGGSVQAAVDWLDHPPPRALVAAPPPPPASVHVPATGCDDVTRRYRVEELQKVCPSDVDPSRKEDFLTLHDFHSVFGMEPVAFSQLAQWKRTAAKKKVNLF